MPARRQPVLEYLEALHAVRRTGRATAEESYKSKLEALLTAIGDRIEPKLFATMELKEEGAGRPDLGVFERRSNNLRLVVEAKPTAGELYDLARGEQVSKYWRRYGFVLATNFREFVLVARDQATGVAVIEARYRMAETARNFWDARPRALAAEHEVALGDFLHGVLLRPAPIRRPADLAGDLARHAREALRRLSRRSSDDLKPLQTAFERALGLTFRGQQGDRFFRSSLVQTLFYGLFSGWMLWMRAQPTDRPAPSFDWHRASESLELPLIAELFDEIAKPTRLRILDLREPVEWAASSLNRVSRAEFFAAFESEHAITLFYEPFLEAFDPKLRQELGVWYTPPDIVRYMVEKVDQVLREELHVPSGFADERVFVLDPAVGTGSYLLSIADRIHRTLCAEDDPTRAALRVKKALCERVFGFEVLTAPYVVSHLQLGMFLRGIGARLTEKEKVGVFLTNALTGWEPPKGPKQTLAFAFLQEEQDRASRVKRESPILVVLGNPPYRGNRGVAVDEEADLVKPYKEGLRSRFGIRKQTLDDPYIRFFRLAERRIGEVGKRGVICYISNYSWLNGIPHVVMRERLLNEFDAVLVDNLHGDRKARERAPDGSASETVFALRGQSPGIKVGTAITTLIKTGGVRGEADVAKLTYRDFDDASAEARRARLLRSLSDKREGDPRTLAPSASRRWSMLPAGESKEWTTWPSLPALLGETFKGVQPGRGGALVSIDREPLEARMRMYFDKTASDAEVAELNHDLMESEARYDASAVRRGFLDKKVAYDPAAIVRCAWLPFDTRYMYWQPTGKLLNEKRAEYFEQVWKGNVFLAGTQKPRQEGFAAPVAVADLGSYYLFDPYATYFPMRRKTESFFDGAVKPGVDPGWLSHLCGSYEVAPLAGTGPAWSEGAMALNDDVFWHVLAVTAAPAYASAHAEALRVDWPRVPLPSSRRDLKTSAAIGRALGDLMRSEVPVAGVTTGVLRASLRGVAVPTKRGGGAINLDQDGFVDAGWASVDTQGRVSMREGLTTPTAGRRRAIDIWINDQVCWKNVPAAAWEFQMGGYPVLKKWLSYREKRILERPLRSPELLYFSEVVRRLTAISAMGSRLDRNYRKCSARTVPSRVATQVAPGT
jgi:hypothetical protein